MKKSFVAVTITGIILAGILTGCGSQSTSATTADTSQTSNTTASATNGTTQNNNTNGNHQNHNGGRGGFGGQLNDVAKILAIDIQTLRDDLKAGQSIADIAKSKGITEDKLISELKTQRQSQLDQLVKDGNMTQDKEQQMLANSTDQLKKFVERKGPFGPNGNNQNGNSQNDGNN